MSAKTSFGVTSLNPPLWKPHPFWQKSFTQPAKVFCGRARLHSLPYRGCWPKAEQGAVLFRGERGATNDVPKGLTILQNIPLSGYPYPATLSGICSANATSPEGGRLIPHPHLAGTQTALPSVPVPTKVSFAVVPAPFWGAYPLFGKRG